MEVQINAQLHEEIRANGTYRSALSQIEGADKLNLTFDDAMEDDAIVCSFEQETLKVVKTFCDDLASKGRGKGSAGKATASMTASAAERTAGRAAGQSTMHSSIPESMQVHYRLTCVLDQGRTHYETRHALIELSFEDYK